MLDSNDPQKAPASPTLENPKTLAAPSLALGVALLILGMFIFSVQDLFIKMLSGGYPVHEIVMFRSLVNIWPLILMAWVIDKGQGLRVQNFWGLILRSFCFSACYTFYYLALAMMSLTQVTALYFTAPLFMTMIAALSGKLSIGWRRWLGVSVGFCGVMIILKPTMDVPLIPTLFALLAAFVYAIGSSLTNWLARTDSAISMSLGFVFANMVVAVIMALLFGSGWAEELVNPNFTFLFRAWVWPTQQDLWLLITVGLISIFGFWLLSTAYSFVPAALIAPAEYSMLLFNAFWGIFIFGEQLELTLILGAILIVGSGLFVLYREGERNQSLLRRLWRPRRPR